MAEATPPTGKILSPTAECQNWELRVKTELESHQKWNEDWGTLFPNKVPNDLKARAEFLEQQLKIDPSEKLPRSSIGFYSPIRDVGKQDHRRKKIFGDGGLSLEELGE
jgi:hypothetical protein